MLFLVSFLFLFTAVLGQLPVPEAPRRLQTRVVGGESIPIHHVPYYAFIRQQNFPHISRCGATLIDPEWLLTAEHCLKWTDLYEVPMEVFLGLSQLAHTGNSTSGRVKRRVVRYFRGPRIEIGNRTQNSDLLLLKLDRKVAISASIKPIRLPVEGARFTYQTAVASGFRNFYNDYDDNSLPDYGSLTYLRGTIISKRDCLAMYRKTYPEVYQEVFRPRAAPETTLCADMMVTRGRNACFDEKRDGGGPLAVCATSLEMTSGRKLCKDNRWQLAGVLLSLSRNCADRKVPELYANVPLFTEWIRRTIQNN